MRERSDEELMADWAAGKFGAFEALYERHRGPLYRYVLRQVNEPATANDLYQGSWEKVIRARGSWRPDAPFRAWLYRIAHNHVVDHFRRQRPQTELQPDTMESPGAGPEQALGREHREARLKMALAQLSPKQREAVLLKLDGGLDLQSIADVLGVKRETAKSRLRYAVAQLKEALKEREP
ncbi:MAG: sigma-70 family RNA polymerase sigma factor [Lysobacterales bacterium]|jgi:RNA polymerase sigma-70 factor (ECF subfamily)